MIIGMAPIKFLYRVLIKHSVNIVYQVNLYYNV